MLSLETRRSGVILYNFLEVLTGESLKKYGKMNTGKMRIQHARRRRVSLFVWRVQKVSRVPGCAAIRFSRARDRAAERLALANTPSRREDVEGSAREFWSERRGGKKRKRRAFSSYAHALAGR